MIHSRTTRTRTLAVLAVAIAVVLAVGIATTAAGQPDVPATTDEESATMELSTAEGTAGEPVTVRLSLSGEAIAGYQAAVRYDPDVVSFESATGVEFASPVVGDDPDAGVVRLAQANSEAVGSDLIAAELRFTIERAGSTELELLDARSHVNDDQERDLATTTSAGSITAGSSGVAEPPGGDTSGGAGTSGPADANAADDDEADSDADENTTTESDSGSDAASTEDETGAPTDSDAGASTDDERLEDATTEADEGTSTSSDEEATGDPGGDAMPGFAPTAAAGVLVIVGAFAARRR